MAEQTPDEISQAFVDFLEDEVIILEVLLQSIYHSHFFSSVPRAQLQSHHRHCHRQ